MIFPYGYIDMFAGVSFNTANIKPMRCRLRSANTARVVTLANGQAFNAGSPGLSGVYPVEQVLEIFVVGSAPGGGAALDTVIQTIGAKIAQEGTLRIRVPGGARNYNATAVFDYMEFVNEGRMDDDDVINWSIIGLHFSQLSAFTAA